ncbi:hypothetical protein F5B22DRAFT_634790 [Xylaria bambusicola]|uniref:uncharacterized protein n=1 Tax=Xylaria bambusicola TaxID=326684 RepID=UPI002008D68F|nr:uncharacterized protein F5B22DRAFT_634790 [Xylaria bambusicola]KAI0521436.1 hypothetical protein F5B22DRAFT_634790 [Xylaria bambusicola]
MSSSPVKPVEETGAGEPTLPPLSSAASTASKKRPASLLPPFELSSSPGLPKPSKRGAREGPDGPTPFFKYPTPIPTSSTGILSSSPLRHQHSRPGLVRTQSTVSERAPLSAVPSLELNENGDMLYMGRSSNSSHYQLSANRLISRIHVKARYIPAASPLEPNRVEIECNGWNGLKLHCQGRTWDLGKGDTFTSETEDTDIMIDVQDARVMVQWPQKIHRTSIADLSDSTWDDSPRSRRRASVPAPDSVQSSPLRRHARIQSPVSPTPASRSSSSLNSLLALDTTEPVAIYEDASADEQDLPKPLPDVNVSFAETEKTNSFSSDLSDLDDENEPDEENDPFIFSFGEFGHNLSNRLAAIAAGSPKQLSRAESGRSTTKPSAEPEEEEETFHPNTDVEVVRNHVVNQLAFSRLSSNPLTTIMNNLPAEEKKDLSKLALRRIIEGTGCVGIITRTGKDAAGKALESEYYYVPEHDTDESRRVAVTDGLRKPSLRACRKQHKQYYWKRPKTP